ncbi:MAG: hypothetical protein KUG82_06865 [Pseudomonadales bacterium]|nr:hypothetical protein [Pseudomonadales bacterium]
MLHISISKFSDSDDESWSSVSDIGKQVCGESLTKDEYLRVEGLYVKSVIKFAELAGFGFRIRELEDRRGLIDDESPYFDLIDCKVKLCGGDEVSIEQMETLVRLCMREILWMRFENSQGCYISFGYDFYMHFGFPESMKLDPENLAFGELTAKHLEDAPFE